jgi:DHA1 family bicyclomycin/chloramphenicol resistance-like MFS transporter
MRTDHADLPSSAPTGRRRLLWIVVLGALSAFGPISIDMYLPGLPEVARDLHVGAAPVALTLTACLAGLAVGQVFIGPLSDAIGRRRPLLIGVGAYALTSLLCAVAPSVYALVALRFVQGVAGAAGIVIARAVVRDSRSGTAAAKMYAALGVVNALGPILAPLAGGQLMRFTSWRGVFLALAGIGLLLMIGTALAVPESLPADRRHTGGLPQTLRGFAALARDRMYLGHVLAASLGMAAMFAYIAGSPFVVQNLYGASPQLFSLIFGLNALGVGAASQLSGTLVGRFGPRTLLRCGLITTALGGAGVLLVVAVGGLGLLWLAVPMFVTVASVGLISPNATALSLADHADKAGTASALLGALQFVLAASAAPLAGLGGERTALPMAVTMACFGVAALACFTVLARRPRVTPRRAAGAGGSVQTLPATRR